jgi:hypothetical protein
VLCLPIFSTGAATVRNRTVDDSGNLETTFADLATEPSLTNSLWGPGVAPGTAAADDPAAYELGVKFTADTNGFITAIRFYQGAGNTGTHRANLWTSGGTLLGTGTFTNESASGWQQYDFPSPVAISAGTTYVASYFAPNGHYSVDNDFFASSYDNPPLHAPSTATSANGVYAYSSTSTFPSSTYQASNYWVDVVFTSSADIPKNAIEAENRLPGTPQSVWDVESGDPTIQGFTTDISYNRGETVTFKIDTSAASYLLDIYRLGFYAGDGARYIDTVYPSVTLPQKQPQCITDSSTALIDCGNWAVSATWEIPSTSTSGIYFARAARTDTGGASHIMFVVRDDNSTSDILFKTSDTTWQAYNDYGGANLYAGGPGPQGGAYKVSYNRPFHTRDFSSYSWVFNAEYPMIRFLEANGYDVAYFTSVDADRSGSQILRHKTMLSVGHDEYWSGDERANVEAARAAGVHLGFFTGNGMFWKTRWEDSIDGSNAPHRTMVCYKETYAMATFYGESSRLRNNSGFDPQDPPTWTGTWRDPRFSPPADGGRPENALQATIFMVNGPNAQTMELHVPQADGQMRFWRNTSVAAQVPGASYSTNAQLLGYEWDVDADNGFRPAGTFHLSTATYTFGAGGPYLLDYGTTYGAGTATHHASMYRFVNGSTSALVFGAGTSQWAWALDGTHDGGTTTPDINLQQATVNLLADMGAQPATLLGGLKMATASSDSTPPTSSITSPAAGSTVQARTVVTIAGNAVDAGGGNVGGVEVSVDGGTTWHPADGRGSWTYNWSPPIIGTATIRSRAVDDSGNLETPSAGITVTIAQKPKAMQSLLEPRTTSSTSVSLMTDAGVGETNSRVFSPEVCCYRGPL